MNNYIGLLSNEEFDIVTKGTPIVDNSVSFTETNISNLRNLKGSIAEHEATHTAHLKTAAKNLIKLLDDSDENWETVDQESDIITNDALAIVFKFEGYGKDESGEITGENTLAKVTHNGLYFYVKAFPVTYNDNKYIIVINEGYTSIGSVLYNSITFEHTIEDNKIIKIY